MNLDVSIVPQFRIEVRQVPIWYGELVRIWDVCVGFEVPTPSFALDLDALRRVLPFV